MSIFLLDLSGTPCVFAHVPKTGGSSIREGRTTAGPVMFDMPEEWKGLPSFGFVRNPFDRIESCWKDFTFLRPMFDGTLEEFIEFNLKSGADVADPKTIKHHMAPMTHPVHGLQHAKFVGRYDTLKEDFKYFCRNFGMTFKDIPKLPHLRDSKNYPNGAWTSKAHDWVKEFYAEDFTLYDQVTDGIIVKG